MKKSLILITFVSLLLVGCGKETNVEKENQTTKPTTTTTITTTTGTSTTTTTTKTTKTTKKTSKTTKKTTTTKQTTTAKKLGKNEYISIEDGKVHKYSFIYNDKDTCNENARKEVPYDEVSKYKPYTFLGCEEAKDLEGKSYWGIVYYTYANDDSDDKIKYYY